MQTAKTYLLFSFFFQPFLQRSSTTTRRQTGFQRLCYKLIFSPLAFGWYACCRTGGKYLFMKKHLPALLIALFVFSVTKAQIQRGYYLIGGDLAGFSLGLSDGRPFDMNITPKVAWFTNNNLAVGGFADVGLSTAEGQGTTFTYGVGPLARYYFGSTAVNTAGTSARGSSRFFLEGTVGLQGINVSGGSSTNGLGLGIGPGLAYFVNQNIALEGLLKYTKAFGFGNDPGSSLLQLGLGFQIYLPRATLRNQASKISQ